MIPIKPLVDYRDTSSSASSLEELFIVDVRGKIDDNSDDSDEEINRILNTRHPSQLRKQSTSENGANYKPKRTNNRVFDPEYDNLPPVSDPDIHIEDDIKLEKFGVVHQYLNFMVIKPLDGVKHLDFDTLLFNEERNAVGEVFEILGQVNNALYTIRFNSEVDAKNTLKLGDYVYYAPDESVLTKIVLTNELMKMKISDGNDGSGEDEFSDDEEEAAHKARKNKNHDWNQTNRRPFKRSSHGAPVSPRSMPPQQNPNAPPFHQRGGFHNQSFFPPGPFSLGPPRFGPPAFNYFGGWRGTQNGPRNF